MSMIVVAAALAVANPTPQAAVAAYGEAIAHNDPAMLARAFQPSAIMYCIRDGAIHATYQAQWKMRMRTETPAAGPNSTKICDYCAPAFALIKGSDLRSRWSIH